METNVSVAGFWYKRALEVALFVSLAIATIWMMATFFLSEPILKSLVVSMWAYGAFIVTIGLATLSLTFHKTKAAKWLTIATVVAFCFAMLLTIQSTGNLASVYLPLWVLASIFAAVGGLATFIPIAIGVVLYGLYLGLYGVISIENWIVFGLVIILPLLVGYMVWSRRLQMQDKSTKEVNDLAQELNQESNKSEIIINAITDGVVLIDANGIIQLINPAAQQIIGWGKEDANGLDYHSVLKIVNSKDEVVDPQVDPVQQCLRTNQTVMTDTLGMRTVSGKRLLISFMVSPLTQNSTGSIIVFRDITAQASQERGQAEFISTASHEMRTPVAAIEGYIGLALNPQTAVIDEKARTFLGKAQEAARHLGRLFQDLLDISKVEDGRITSKPVVVDITAFIRTMLEDFSGQFTEKGLTQIFVPDTSTGVTPVFYVNVDLDHFRELFTNLVTNAIKYTKEGSVTINITGDDEHVYLSVKDSGIGIPAEDIPHLFQKFYRVDNSDTREIVGSPGTELEFAL